MNPGTRPLGNYGFRAVKVNPQLEVVYYGTLILENKGDEKTAVRFTIDADGNVTNVNTLFKSIVEVNKL